MKKNRIQETSWNNKFSNIIYPLFFLNSFVVFLVHTCVHLWVMETETHTDSVKEQLLDQQQVVDLEANTQTKEENKKEYVFVLWSLVSCNYPLWI